MSIENKITELIEQTVGDLGFEIVKVTLHGGSRKVVEIRIDRRDGDRVQVADCSEVSKHVAAIFDVEDIIKDKYFLEVASAGIERPLTKLQDFVKLTGKEVKIKLREPHNNKFSFKGTIDCVQDEEISIKSKNVLLKFAYSNIKAANLILTNELFKQIAKGTNKKSRKAYGNK